MIAIAAPAREEVRGRVRRARARAAEQARRARAQDRRVPASLAAGERAGGRHRAPSAPRPFLACPSLQGHRRDGLPQRLRASVRVAAMALSGGALVCAYLALSILLDPVPSGSDVLGFAFLSLSLLSAYLAVAISRPVRWWTWWIPAAWLGLDVAALFLAYKDTFLLELGFFGPIDFALQLMIHVLIAPIEVAIGFLVGFVEPGAWIVVLVCVAVAILGAELIRRRLWPRSQKDVDRVQA